MSQRNPAIMEHLRKNCARRFALLAGCVLFAAGMAYAEENPLFRIEENRKWGFIDASGKIVIEPEYQGCDHQFSEGLAAVMVDNKWGYIDKQNRMLIPPQFVRAQPFHDGFARVQIGDFFRGQMGIIDKTGKFVRGPSDYIAEESLSEGMRLDRDGKLWGYMDAAGTVKIPHQFRVAHAFSGGLAGVELDDSTAGFIDTDGKWVIRLKDAVPVSGFADGLAPVRNKATGKVGYIDKTGSWKIEPQFSKAVKFSQDRAPVEIARFDETGWPIRHWGVINKEGKMVVPAIYDGVANYREGFAVALKDNKWGYLDLEGKLAIPCQYNAAYPFENGLAYVLSGHDTDEWGGYINSRGEYVWRPSDYKDRDAARVKEQAQRAERKPTIPLLTNARSDTPGLLVSCSGKVPLKGKDAGKVLITVINLLNEEVFLEVTGYDSMSCYVQHWEGDWVGHGGSRIARPDNTQLIKRLHASAGRNESGQWVYEESSRVTIEGRFIESVLARGRAKGKMTVPISGYYRKSGERFSERIDLPIEFVDSQEPPSS